MYKRQGYVAMIGVFIDTFIVLTMTALVIVTTRALPESYNAVSGGYTGAELSQFAYSLVSVSYTHLSARLLGERTDRTGGGDY